MSLNKVNYKREVITVHGYHSIFRTLSEMSIMENVSLRDREFINFIETNFKDLKKEKNIFVIILKVHNWINNNIEYLPDAYDETLISPRIIIYIRKGDCDDFSMLLKTILKHFNINVNYILLAKQKNEYSHIANCFYFNKKYYYIDGTLKKNEYPKEYIYNKIIGL